MSAYGVVVITHNSQAEVGHCLDSLAAAAATDVVVVDNGSTDGTVEKIRNRGGVRLIENPWNRGFAAAANQGIASLNLDCVLLLNPDVRVHGGLDAMARACAMPDVAAAGGRLIEEDGRCQLGFMVRRFPTVLTLILEVLGLNRLWPGNPVNRRYRCHDFDGARAAQVEQPAGAFLMVRRDVWASLGGFDETFFPLWFEDVDFCKRADEAGCRILYVPDAVGAHAGGHSVRQLSCSNRWTYWYGTLLWYAAKHFRPMAVRAISAAVMLGVLMRAVSALFRLGSRGSTAAAFKVIRLAGRYVSRPERKCQSAFGFQG